MCIRDSPYSGDKLGRLALTLEGLHQRDAYVLSACRRAGLPVVTTMGGGYAPRIDDIVEAHCQTVRLACAMASAPTSAAAPPPGRAPASPPASHSSG